MIDDLTRSRLQTGSVHRPKVLLGANLEEETRVRKEEGTLIWISAANTIRRGQH